MNALTISATEVAMQLVELIQPKLLAGRISITPLPFRSTRSEAICCLFSSRIATDRSLRTAYQARKAQNAANFLGFVQAINKPRLHFFELTFKILLPGNSVEYILRPLTKQLSLFCLSDN